MTTPLTADVVLDVIQNLSVAFAGKRSEADMKRLAFVYRDALESLSAEAVRWAAKRVIKEDQYFPKAARLIELAQKWETNERADSHVAGAIVDPMFCRTCRERLELRPRWRPMNPRRGNDNDFRYWLTSADGQWLLLEQHGDTHICSCHRSLWVPDPRCTVPAVPVGHVGYHMPFMRSEIVVEIAA
jgi:hypothetical protein